MNEQQRTSLAGSDPSPRMRLPARPVKRFSTSMNPDAHPLHGLDPVLTRKGKMAHKGVLFMVAGGMIAMAYAFNVGGLGTYLDQFFTDVDKSAQSENSLVVSTIITIAPYVGAALLGLILYGILRWLWGGVKSASKASKLKQRPEVSLNDFIRQAKEQLDVRPKVARESYALLKPHYHDRMRVQFTDNLTDDLHLSPHDIVDLYAGALRKSDRHLRSVETAVQPTTVMELLQMVEKAPVRAAAPELSRIKSGARGRSMIRPIAKMTVPKQ
jgi:hypothetical protein